MPMINKLVAMAAFGVAVLLEHASNVEACSCADLAPCDQMVGSEIVARVTLTSVGERVVEDDDVEDDISVPYYSYTDRPVTADVKKVYKGTLSDEITFFGHGCGRVANLDVGADYLVGLLISYPDDGSDSDGSDSDGSDSDGSDSDGILTFPDCGMILHWDGVEANMRLDGEDDDDEEDDDSDTWNELEICSAMYLGCFADQADDRVMEDGFTSSAWMTNERCIRHCNDEGATHAATQHGTECWCFDESIYEAGDEELELDRFGTGTCNIVCPRTSKFRSDADTCGGDWSFSLYEL